MMQNKNTINGFELLFRIDMGMNQYYEGYTITTLFESYVEIADTNREESVLFEADVDENKVRNIIDKLQKEHFYIRLLDELKSSELPSNPEKVKYSLTLGLGCRSEQHYLNDVTTPSVKELLEYLRKEFQVSELHQPYL